MPTLPHMVHLWALGPPSGYLTMYSYSCLSPPASRNNEKLLYSFVYWQVSINVHSQSLVSFDVHIQQIFGRVGLLTVFANITKYSREVNTFNMLPHIKSVCSNFTTKRAFVTLRSCFRGLDNIVIQLLVTSCKQDTCEIKTLVYICYRCIKPANYSQNSNHENGQVAFNINISTF